MGAPVGDTGVLEGGLRGAAGVLKADEAFAAAGGMKDQSGGRRKSRARKSKKSKKSNKSRQQRRNRRQSGGCGAAAVGASTMLLDPSAATKAGTGNFNLLA
jgi:hypothetical protein